MAGFFREEGAAAARGALLRVPQPGEEGEGRPAARYSRRLGQGRRYRAGDRARRAGKEPALDGGALQGPRLADAGEAQAARRGDRHLEQWVKMGAPDPRTGAGATWP